MRQFGIHAKLRKTPIDGEMDKLNRQRQKTRLEWTTLLIRRHWEYFLATTSMLLVFFYMVIAYYGAGGAV